MNPPVGVKAVVEAVCILMGVKPVRHFDKNTNKASFDYWASAKKSVLNAGLLDALVNYDKDHVPVSVLTKLKKVTKQPDFEVQHIKSVSSAAAGMAMWVLAIESYAEFCHSEKGRKLNLLGTRVREIENALASAPQLESEESKKPHIPKARHSLPIKAPVSPLLQGAIQDMVAFWKGEVSRIDKEMKCVPGEALLRAGSLVLAGNPNGRNKRQESWKRLITAKDIPLVEKKRESLTLEGWVQEAQQAGKVGVLIDPEGMAVASLGKIATVSARDPKLGERIGSTQRVFVTDVPSQLPVALNKELKKEKRKGVLVLITRVETPDFLETGEGFVVRDCQSSEEELTDAMLEEVVRKERPRLLARRTQLGY